MENVTWGDSKRSVGHLHDNAAAELLLGTVVVGHLHLLDLGSRARSVRSGLRMDLHGKSFRRGKERKKRNEEDGLGGGRTYGWNGPVASVGGGPGLVFGPGGLGGALERPFFLGSGLGRGLGRLVAGGVGLGGVGGLAVGVIAHHLERPQLLVVDAGVDAVALPLVLLQAAGQRGDDLLVGRQGGVGLVAGQGPRRLALGVLVGGAGGAGRIGRVGGRGRRAGPVSGQLRVGARALLAAHGATARRLLGARRLRGHAAAAAADLWVGDGGLGGAGGRHVGGGGGRRRRVVGVVQHHGRAGRVRTLAQRRARDARAAVVGAVGRDGSARQRRGALEELLRYWMRRHGG